MKLIIVTQDDPFYLPVFFESFLNRFGKMLNHISLAGVVIQRPLGQKSKKALLHRMVDLYGPLFFIITSFRFVLLKIACRLHRLGLPVRACSIEAICRDHGVPILRYRNVNHPRFIEYVRRNKVDLVVSVAAAQIFKRDVLRAPKRGCINIHNAPLPDYRGMMPNFWQMYHGEEYSVATVHEMVEELDKGRIIYQQRTPIETGMTLDALIRATKRSNANALHHVLGMFQRGEVQYCPLPRRAGSYFSFPSRRDVIEFKRRGHRIV